MDPNANLEEQIRLAKSIQEKLDSDNAYDVDDAYGDLDRLAELVLSLDNWLSNYGFLPTKWKRHAEPR